MELVNLKELIKYHPYHISTFANFANVTVDLLEAALNGEEELTGEEIRKISRCSGLMPSILMAPTLVLLKRERYEHHQMIEKLRKEVRFILDAADAEDNKTRKYVEWEVKDFADMLCDFRNGKHVSYCRCLGTKVRIDRILLYMRLARIKPRGRKVV